MSFKIESVVGEAEKANAILHKIADIPGGVTIATGSYGSEGVIPQGTPLYTGTNGLYKAALAAVAAETATNTATEYFVKKGHLLKVGDKLQKGATTSVDITAIDTSDALKDKITVDTTLGKAIAVGDNLGQYYTGTPVAITGEAVSFKKNDNAFASAWVIAVVNKNVMPEPIIKPAGVQYV